jgi:hypothetical protein
VWPAALVLTASHLFSFLSNYIRNGEYKRISLRELDVQPYSRAVVMHVAIILGGILMMLLGTTVMGLAALVVLKICFDVNGHVRERRKCAALSDKDSYHSGRGPQT